MKEDDNGIIYEWFRSSDEPSFMIWYTEVYKPIIDQFIKYLQEKI